MGCQPEDEVDSPPAVHPTHAEIYCGGTPSAARRWWQQSPLQIGMSRVKFEGLWFRDWDSRFRI